jgi:hypothetical protein
VDYPIQWRKVNRNEVISQWNYDANEVKKITNKLKKIDMKLTKSQLKEIIREEILREVNGQLNKKVMTLLKNELNDLDVGSPTHQYAISLILESALTDANFHPESRKVSSLFRKAKYELDPKDEKDFVKRCQKLGRDISKMCDYGGDEIAQSIGFYTSMTIGRPLGASIEKLVESK